MILSRSIFRSVPFYLGWLRGKVLFQYLCKSGGESHLSRVAIKNEVPLPEVEFCIVSDVAVLSFFCNTRLAQWRVKSRSTPLIWVCSSILLHLHLARRVRWSRLSFNFYLIHFHSSFSSTFFIPFFHIYTRWPRWLAERRGFVIRQYLEKQKLPSVYRLLQKMEIVSRMF